MAEYAAHDSVRPDRCRRHHGRRERNRYLTVSEEALAARTVVADAADGRLPFDILCVEGALLRGPNGSGRFQMLSGSGRPLIAWVREHGG